MLESLGQAGRDREESVEKQKTEGDELNWGGFSAGLIGGRFNMETESLINGVGTERKRRM